MTGPISTKYLRPLMNGGQLPSQEILDRVYAACNIPAALQYAADYTVAASAFFNIHVAGGRYQLVNSLEINQLVPQGSVNATRAYVQDNTANGIVIQTNGSFYSLSSEESSDGLWIHLDILRGSVESRA